MYIKRDKDIHIEQTIYELKEEIEQMGLENAYQQYCSNVFRNYLSTLTIFHLLTIILHMIVIIILRKEYATSPWEEPFIMICSAVFAVLCFRPYMREQFEREHPSIKYIVSWGATLIMAAPDLCFNVYYLAVNQSIYRPFYSGYIVTVAYLCMPVPGILPAIYLGGTLTLLYCANIICVIVAYQKDSTEYASLLVPDITYLIGLNLIGIYIRFHLDALRRVAFLIKRNQIKHTLICKYAKGREYTLLLSIIPEKVAKQISKNVEPNISLKFSRSRIEAFPLTNDFFDAYILYTIPRKSFIEQHDDVSILFADIVNYTHLSTHVDVETLILLLHDLFERFDTACTKFSITRIKFLGDCYYCVSGMPVSHPLHAVCCVEMGLAIIEHVRDVRTLSNVDIDMRVGVHSGDLLAGIIGKTKWQYDIWSRDVDIANRLEQTGVPSRVHVTDATLKLIEGYYEYENGTDAAKLDPILIKYNIKTHLIIKRAKYMENSEEWNNYLRSKEDVNDPQINNISSQHNVAFSEVIEQTNDLMSKAIDSLPICRMHLYETCFIHQPRFTAERLEDYRAKRCISKIFLLFDSYSKEIEYLSILSKEAVRYAVLLGLLILLCVFISQAVNKIIQDVYLYYCLNTGIVCVAASLTVGYWRFDSLKRPTQPYRSVSILYDALNVKEDERNPFKAIAKNLLMYTLFFVAIVVTTLAHVMTCDDESLENESLFILVEDGIRILCTNSWSLTNSYILFTALALSWPNIPFIMMLLYTGIMFIYYLSMIFYFDEMSFESSIMTHMGVGTEYSHVLTFIPLYLLYILYARHTIFLAKYNYQTQIQLEKKIEHAKVANETIKLLLYNILPLHVVDAFLGRRKTAVPFYEHHRRVAIIFATVIHKNDETKDFRFMNEIICEFDEILSSYRQPIKVEKIKVINWTYMAACGFTIRTTSKTQPKPDTVYLMDVSSSNVGKTRFTVNDSTLLGDDDPFHISSEESVESLSDWKTLHDKLIVHILANFATDLLKVVHKHSIRLQTANDLVDLPITLRVGISSGEIVAGIVGASVAHYDIWGDAVNMASRMDSSGIPGRIQVTEHEANILKSLNVECSYRGMTYVKGRGKMPTYFIETDESLNIKILE